MAEPIPQFKYASHIDAVLPPRHDDLVWHYTSASGTLGILHEQALWASSITQMNDSQELEYGLHFIEEMWKSWDGRSLKHKAMIRDWLRHARSKVDGSERLDSYLVCGSTNGASHT